eukprot:Tbor_TRINITY_DN7633_c0_g1::TRINITY_DN7633_c0_g1_i1::g.1006::m.1006
MKRTMVVWWKMPKNIGVSPQFDTWNKKYEPWEHLRAMGRLSGTGFYIPPEWYNHFRMFPPINNNFLEEQTMNPMNEAEPTQVRSELDTTRAAVRDELGKRSRLLVSEGMRYYNIFWVQKPIDEMERKYYQLIANGATHEGAIRAALEQFHATLSTKKRVAAIQAEEAKLSGNFVTMREASAIMNTLVHIEKKKFTPYNATKLAEAKYKMALTGGQMEGTTRYVEKRRPTMASSSESAATNVPTKNDAESLFTFLEDDGGFMVVDINENADDIVSKLKEVATNYTGDDMWYTGEGPDLPVSDSK